MSDIIKKGWLDVKKKNIFGSAYKRKFVILRNNSALRCKTVDILDTETVDENADIIPLWDAWTVQDKSSKTKGRHPFELIMGEEALLTFSCCSIEERWQWRKAFDTLNQLSSDGQQSASAITEFFPVALVKNRSAQEIGHSGQYLLSIRDNDIILHWRTGAIAHHWPRKSIVKLFINPNREGYLVLHTGKIGSSRPQHEFEFMTDSEIAFQILKLWNICLLEAIPCPEKLNEVSSILNSGSKNDKPRSPTKKAGSKSFRTRKSPSMKQKADPDSLRRADSMPRGRAMTASSISMTTGAPPVAPRSRKSLTRSLGGSRKSFEESGVVALSQDTLARSPSVFRSPPPLPPRPNDSSSGDDDPDYAYIDEQKVKGPENHSLHASVKNEPGPSIDEQLKDIERSIKRENKAKKRAAADAEKRRAHTIHRSNFPAHRRTHPPALSLPLGPKLTFAPTDPEDYLDPVPSKSAQSRFPDSDNAACYEVPVAIHSRSSSEPDPMNASSPTKFLSQPVETGGYQGGSRLLSSSMSPDRHSPNVSPTMILDENRPVLPSRSWRRTSTASNNSVTSLSSVGSMVSKSSGAAVEEVDHLSPTAAGHARVRSASMTDDAFSKLGDGLQNSVIPEEPHDSGSSTPAMDGTADTSHVSATDPSAIDGGDSSPPPLPPRSPLKEKLSCQSSTSSVSSTSSSRCPRCRNKRTKSRVGKTVSLNDHKRRSSPNMEDGPKGSLPDLNKSLSVPGDSFSHRQHHRHSQECRGSPYSSTDGIQSPSLPSNKYLELIADPSIPPTDQHSYLELCADEPESPPSQLDNELQSQLEMLDSFVQTLEYLENKAILNSNGSVSSSRAGHDPKRDEQKRAVRTDLDDAIKQAKQVELDLSQPAKQLPSENGKAVVLNGHTPCRRISGTRGPPTLYKHQTVTDFPLSPNNSVVPTSHTHHANGSLPHHNGSLPQSAPPPIPPRSSVSLTQEEQPSSPRTPVTKVHSPGRQANSGGFHSLPRSLKGRASLQRRFKHEDRESSTVFIHHLKRSMHMTEI